MTRTPRLFAFVLVCAAALGASCVSTRYRPLADSPLSEMPGPEPLADWRTTRTSPPVHVVWAEEPEAVAVVETAPVAAPVEPQPVRVRIHIER